MLSLSCSSAVLGCVSVSLPVLAILLGSYVKLLDVFYAAKQAETVSYAVVFNVLLNKLACRLHESCATKQGYCCKHYYSASVGIPFTFKP